MAWPSSENEENYIHHLAIYSQSFICKSQLQNFDHLYKIFKSEQYYEINLISQIKKL